MSSSSRRKARRLRDERAAAVRTRMDRRREQIRAGTHAGTRALTRRDREALWRGQFGFSAKQRNKHANKRSARYALADARRREVLLSALHEATTGAPVQVTGVAFLGSCVPYVGNGTATDRAGAELVWEFRFRYDRAFLEVGIADPACDSLVGQCLLAASRDDVTGEPYEGWLRDAQALTLLSELFAQLAAPAGGALFAERFTNTLDLLAGGGDPTAPTLIR